MNIFRLGEVSTKILSELSDMRKTKSVQPYEFSEKGGKLCDE